MNKTVLALSLVMLTSGSAFAKDKLTFDANVNEVCGVKVTNDNGSLAFSDTNPDKYARLKGETNQKGNKVNVVFNTDDFVNEMDNTSHAVNLYEQNGSLVHPRGITLDRNEDVRLYAKVNGVKSTEVYAGKHEVVSTITVSCN